jgi:hypothetical protein
MYIYNNVKLFFIFFITYRHTYTYIHTNTYITITIQSFPSININDIYT